jgi:hypothetical protein
LEFPRLQIHGERAGVRLGVRLEVRLGMRVILIVEGFL